MKQIFIVGASTAYGVGAHTAGWGDLVKQYAHHKMYAPGGVGEQIEVYNFAKAGAKVDFVIETLPDQLKQYGRGGDTMFLFAIGGNNSKAEGTPDKYVSTVEAYLAELQTLLTLLKQHSSAIIAVSSGYIDESKLNPKINPFTGRKSYFSNVRRKLFSEAAQKLYAQEGVTFVEISVPEAEWVQNYLYEDGLHPNQAGHALIFEAIKPHLDL